MWDNYAIRNQWLRVTVHPTDTTGLVVITQLQPITVVFTIPEDNIPAVLDKLKRPGQAARSKP